MRKVIEKHIQPPRGWRGLAAWVAMALAMGGGSAIAPASARADAPAVPAAKAVKVVVDTSDAPELQAYGEKVKALSEQWYPQIVAMLPGEGFTAPDHVEIVFRKDYRGVAATGGTHVVCAVKWFKDHPDDLGAIVHELAHVVQHYTRGPRPGWLVEGIADWVRFYHYEPEGKRPHPDPERSHYNDSYRTSAAFLNWAAETFDKELVVKLNVAFREGKYDEGLWKQLTGKTLEELGQAWKESLRKR